MRKYGDVDIDVLDPNSGAIVPVYDESQRQACWPRVEDDDEADKANRVGEEAKEGASVAGNGNENELRWRKRHSVSFKETLCVFQHGKDLVFPPSIDVISEVYFFDSEIFHSGSVNLVSKVGRVNWRYSFRISWRNDRSKISFQLTNVRHEMSLVEFGEVYGIKNEGEKAIMKGFKTVSIHFLWSKMTGVERLLEERSAYFANFLARDLESMAIASKGAIVIGGMSSKDEKN
ncbi:hypothetical protein Droror1_Dr00019912 [Drosera rotundifolia]